MLIAGVERSKMIDTGRIWHMAKLMDQRGRISPECADDPRPLRRNEYWTLTWDAVTCPECLSRRESV